MNPLASDNAPTTKPSTMSASSAEGASSSGGSGEMQGDQPTRDDRQNGPPHTSRAPTDRFCNRLRTMVSQNRRRFRDDGFNLDLTYITDRIIAMGYPADATEAIYRNSMESTVKFLEYYHKGHYKVFNLRGQYVYNTKKFHDRVLSFEMVDHHPPRLEYMAPFCREVHEYLNADSRNIVAVHCKAGKGRTGVMICAYLCYISFYTMPRQNMDYYSIVRTHNNKGVTIPSQRRYVYYFSHLREQELNYIPLRCELVGIFLEQPPKQSSFPVKKGLEVRVMNGDVAVFEGKPIYLSKDEWEEEERVWENAVSKGEDSFNENSGTGLCLSRRAFGWEVPDSQRVFLEGDVRVVIRSVNALSKTKIGHCWFNTMFTCETFCGGAYIHGDEAFPYPPGGTSISEPIIEPAKSSSSPPPSPTSTAKADGGNVSGRRAPSMDTKKPSKTKGFGIMRRLADGVSSRSNGESSVSEKRDKKRRQKNTDRQSVAPQFTLVRPPGLDRHCSESSLKQIYGNWDKKAPRDHIENMMLHALNQNIVSDSYNERRLSVPQQGIAVEMAPQGRPNASGPNAIMKREDEHVMVFSVLEMDKACKNKELDAGFKMIVVTRCLSDKELDVRLANKFLEITREKQGDIDEKKKEQVEARQRRLQSGGGRGSDEGADAVCASTTTEFGDPRQEDPFLKKYFYRQRADSVSKYPSHKHRCPLVKYSTPRGTVPTGGESVDHDLPSTSRGLCTEDPNAEVPRDEERDDWMEQMDNLDRDVRSYHPEDQKWRSCASSTTVSSESDAPPDHESHSSSEESSSPIPTPPILS